MLMLNLIAAVAALTAALLMPAPAHAGTWAAVCYRVQTPVSWNYCINKDTQSTSEDVVYQLHGAGENERSWFRDPHGRAMRSAWGTLTANPPTVISISFGPLWLLASKNAKPKSGLYDVLTQYVIPYIENKHPYSGRRSLFGYSMGGYNGSQLLLKNPELFARVALGCPAMATVSPFATSKEIADYISRTKARPELVRFTLDVSQNHYADDAAYQQDNPINKALNKMGPSSPPLHISCGDKDGFGFQEGAKVFADVANANGAQITWQSLNGGHCEMDEADIAAFLIN